MDDIGDLLEELRAIKDEKEELNRHLSDLSGKQADIEAKLIEWHEKTGLDKAANDAGTVSFDSDAMRVSYDPEQWPQIVAWAIETGNGHIIQRRLTDAKVLELVEGGTELPPGLRMESYTKISFRRK